MYPLADVLISAYATTILPDERHQCKFMRAGVYRRRRILPLSFGARPVLRHGDSMSVDSQSMVPNPYEPPQAPSDVRLTPKAKAPYSWAWPLAGTLLGVVAGPILWLLLCLSFHEDYDPPVFEYTLKELAARWGGILVLTTMTSLYGGAVGLALSFSTWRLRWHSRT